VGTSVHIRYLPRHSFLVDQSLELWIPTVVDSEEDVCLDGKEIRSRCNERLKAKSEVCTRLAYTGLCGGLEHLKIETRLRERGFCVFICIRIKKDKSRGKKMSR
jgi:hypothetical protein